MLEVGVGERPKQCPGERQVHARDLLVGPQRARDPVDRPQDLPRLRLLRVEQVLEVAGRLVKVEDERKLNVRHRLLHDAHTSGTTISLVPRAELGSVRPSTRPRPSSGASCVHVRRADQRATQMTAGGNQLRTHSRKRDCARPAHTPGHRRLPLPRVARRSGSRSG